MAHEEQKSALGIIIAVMLAIIAVIFLARNLGLIDFKINEFNQNIIEDALHFDKISEVIGLLWGLREAKYAAGVEEATAAISIVAIIWQMTVRIAVGFAKFVAVVSFVIFSFVLISKFLVTHVPSDQQVKAPSTSPPAKKLAQNRQPTASGGQAVPDNAAPNMSTTVKPSDVGTPPAQPAPQPKQPTDQLVDRIDGSPFFIRNACTSGRRMRVNFGIAMVGLEGKKSDDYILVDSGLVVQGKGEPIVNHYCHVIANINGRIEVGWIPLFCLDPL